MASIFHDDKLSAHPALIQRLADNLKRAPEVTREDAEFASLLKASLDERAANPTGKPISPQQFAREFREATADMSAEERLRLADWIVEVRGDPGFVKSIGCFDENGAYQTVYPNEESVSATESLKAMKEGIERVADARRKTQEMLKEGLESWRKMNEAARRIR